MPDATAQATDPPLEGKWEGEWNPQTRPYFVQVDLDARRVWIDAFGVKPITPKGWTSEAGTIRFYFDVGRRVDVTLHVEGDELKGTISSKDRSAPITMKRLPVLQKPRDRIEAWQQDLDVLLERFLPRDRSFSSQGRAEFQAGIANLRAQIANLPDDIIAVRVAQAVALSNNAHTRLSLGRPRVRIRPARFSDGVFIVKADARNTDLLGCRLESVAGREVAERVELVERVESPLDDLTGGLEDLDPGAEVREHGELVGGRRIPRELEHGVVGLDPQRGPPS